VRLAASLAPLQRVSLLPYHRTGTGKLERLGITPATFETATPELAFLAVLVARFTAAGVRTTIGG
jgi:hypothetical protein